VSECGVSDFVETTFINRQQRVSAVTEVTGIVCREREAIDTDDVGDTFEVVGQGHPARGDIQISTQVLGDWVLES
jgi:hypothetical protein